MKGNTKEGACGAFWVRYLTEPAKKDLKEGGEKDRPFFCAVSEGKFGEENEVKEGRKEGKEPIFLEREESKEK